MIQVPASLGQGLPVKSPRHFQVLKGENPSCVKCPEEAEECDVGRVKMRQGFMVNVSGNLSDYTKLSDPGMLSKTYNCPNGEACPGRRGLGCNLSHLVDTR